MSRLKFAGTFGTMLFCSVAAVPLHAQSAPATAAPSEATEDDGSDVIIVTANRREENLQEVAGVVQALDADQLRQDGIVELRQLQTAVPGLSIANQEGNVEIFIRGVGSSNNTELGDPGAAPHLNGTYIPRPRGLGLMFYDLERVEVNKGPQGTRLRAPSISSLQSHGLVNSAATHRPKLPTARLTVRKVRSIFP